MLDMNGGSIDVFCVASTLQPTEGFFMLWEYGFIFPIAHELRPRTPTQLQRKWKLGSEGVA